MGRQDPSKMEANLGASWPPRPPPKWRPTWIPKTEFLRPKLASTLGVLAALGRHKLFFWSLFGTSFPALGGKQKFDFSKDLITKSIFSGPWGLGRGSNKGSKKIAYGAQGPPRPPSKIEVNLAFKRVFLGAQVGLHFGGGLGGQEAPKSASILEASWRPRSAH